MTPEDIAFLEELEFPYDQAPELGNLLLKNKEIANSIADAAKYNKYHVFHGGLPALKRIIKTKEDLQKAGIWLVRIENKILASFFDFLSKAIEYGLIRGIEDLQMFEGILDIAGSNIGNVINYGVPAVQKFARNRQSLIDACISLAEIAKSAGDSQYIFEDSLPVLIEEGIVKSVSDLKLLAEMAQLGGKGYSTIFLDRPEFVKWYFDQLLADHKPTLKEAKAQIGYK